MQETANAAKMQETANAAKMQETANAAINAILGPQGSAWAFVKQHANLQEVVHGDYCELFGPPNELSVYGERIFLGLRKLLGELIGRGAPGYWALHGHGVQAGWFFPPSPSLKDGAFSKSNALAPMSEERKRHMRALAFSAPKPMHATWDVTPYPALYVLPRGSLYANVA